MILEGRAGLTRLVTASTRDFLGLLNRLFILSDYITQMLTNIVNQTISLG
jgi:hypothetical protein